MPALTTCLWFDGQGEEAATFYTSLFPNSRITEVARYGPAGSGTEGDVMIVAFELDGHRFTALNGGPRFTFSEAISIQIDCADQHEVDRYWEALTDGGEESDCGWLRDRYGLSWQVVPRPVIDLLADPDPAKANRAMEAVLSMKKIVIAEVERAAAAG